MPERPDTHVLVVDDSAVARQLLSEILLQEPGLTVSVAANPLIALEKMRRIRPHAVVLDLDLPEMDGMAFLERLMATDPIPVVVCSGLARHGAEAVLRAIDIGAVAVIEKPRLEVRRFLLDSAVRLRATVADAVRARVRPRTNHRVPAPKEAAARLAAPHVPGGSDKVVAIGASTGGTEALRTILEAMPPDAPGILVVQHMPELFTRAFAERLDRCCRIEVKEAEDGDRVEDGRALVAPGNRHLTLRRSGAHYTVEVADGPLVSRHRPSVDALFRSVAAAAGHDAVGVILTGMGDDGAAGLLEMRKAGASTLGQDEASSVVYGMPREAAERGAVGEVVGLERMAATILRQVAALS